MQSNNKRDPMGTAPYLFATLLAVLIGFPDAVSA